MPSDGATLQIVEVEPDACRCGAAIVWEDSGMRYGRRFVCTAGHSVYLGLARPERPTGRLCSQCGGPTGRDDRTKCEACRAHSLCVVCGREAPYLGRRSCSDECHRVLMDRMMARRRKSDRIPVEVGV
jgi:predicted nucleic acid-binding Zn ribbon protein